MAKRGMVRILGHRTSIRSIANTLIIAFILIFIVRYTGQLQGDTHTECRSQEEHIMLSISNQLRLRCEGSNSTLYLTTTEDEQVLSVTSDESQCFSHALLNYCNETYGRRVPNIIHYVWFGIKNMTFYQLVSFLSVHKFQKPCVILVHGNVVPVGPYWRYLIHKTPNIIHVETTPPHHVANGNILPTMTHKSNIMRMMVLQEHGGIYLDLDTVLLRSLDPLMNYPVTMSKEYKSNLWNGLILAERDPLFIRHWITLFNQEYYYAHKRKYFEFSLFLPTRIAKAHPSWIHVEEMTFCTPDGNHLNLIFEENFDWKENYAMHLYIRFYEVCDDFVSVRRLNTTIGARTIGLIRHKRFVRRLVVCCDLDVQLARAL